MSRDRSLNRQAIGHFFSATALRALTLVSRSVIVLYIARYLGPDELGRYGLVSATVGYGVLAFGMEFHYFNTRQILRCTEARDQARRMRDQFALHAIVTPLGLALLSISMALGWLPAIAAAWMIAILFLDHIGQELTRLMMTLHRPMFSNVMLFLRSAWIYPIAAFGILNPSYRTLEIIWIGWLMGAALSIITGAFALRHFPWRELRCKSINWEWIREGLRTCSPFMLATLSSMSLPVADRYAVGIFHGTSNVGIYTFYAAIGAATQSLAHANAGMYLYPRVVSAFMRNDMTAYRVAIRSLAWRSPAMTAGFALMVAISIYPLLWLVERPVYSEHVSILWLVLGGAIVAQAGEAPHAALYVRHRDKEIVVAECLTALVGMASLALLVPRFNIYGAAFSILIAWSALYILRVAFLFGRRPPRQS